MEDSLLHDVKEVYDDRKPKVRALLAVNPTCYINTGRNYELEAKQEYLNKIEVAKKKPSLQEGYIRLFGGETDNALAAVGREKGAGKRIFAEAPRPRPNDHSNG